MTKRQAARRTGTRNLAGALHLYGAPLGMTIARINPECKNMLNSTGNILPQIAGVAK